MSQKTEAEIALEKKFADQEAATKQLKEDAEQYAKDLAKLQKENETQGGLIAELEKKAKGPDVNVSLKSEISRQIKENHDKIKQLHASKHGVIELELKAVENITTGSATNPDGIPELVGTQVAPPGTINLRTPFALPLTTNVDTDLAAYPYTESMPKEGGFDFIAEGTTKSKQDFKLETRYAQPVKAASYIKLTDESIQDIRGMQSIANDLLFKKHGLKKQDGILFGDGISPNPKGATSYGRTFVAGDMALAVTNPNIMDVINAVVTDIYTTHNYEDEVSYMPSLVLLHPTDFYIQFVSAKNGDGNPLYPTASLFNRVNIGGMTIIPERSIPVGKIFVCDMSKYNTTNYVPYSVQIGWVNDDFINNQFVILAESRFHAFVKKLDEQAFVYDNISTVKDAITAL